MRLRITLFVLLLVVIASTVQAGCIKCDQTTGYICYMRLDGTKSGCDNPSDAGCATWGSCTHNVGDDCTDDCVYTLGQAEPMSNSLEVASVTITSPTDRVVPVAPAMAVRSTI
jgi:Anaphase-promoting complex subunit 11 RING-H2 finger